MSRRFARLTLIALMLLTLLPTLAGAEAYMAYINPEGFPIVNEEKTLTIMVNNSSKQPDFGEVEMWKSYERMTGVHIDWVNIPAGTASEKLNLAFVSGELPDVFLKFNISNINQYKFGSEGMLLNLNENNMLEKYAPNFYAYMKAHPSVEQALTFEDGSIYSLPQAVESLYNKVAAKMFFNQTWLDKVGMEMPTTTDELYQVLKAFKEQDANGNGIDDEIPMSGPNYNYIVWALRGAFGAGNRGVHDQVVDVDPETGKARVTAASNDWKQMLEYMKMLFDEQLIDQEIFSQKSARHIAKASEGLYGSVIDASITGMPSNVVGQFTGITSAFKGPDGDQYWFPIRSDLHSTGAFVITTACKTPELALKWIDYFYTDAGSKLFFYGEEGVSHVDNGDGTYSFVQSVADAEAQGLSHEQAIAAHVTAGGNNPVIYMDQYFMAEDKVSLATAQAMVDYFPEIIWPIIIFTPEESDELSVIRTDINTYVNKMVAEFVTGKTSFDQWDNYIKQIETMGGSRMTEIYDAAMARTGLK